MTPENKPEHHTYPNPPTELVKEMSLESGLYRVVDDLFTHQSITKKLVGVTDEARMNTLLATWKQSLTHHLTDLAHNTGKAIPLALAAAIARPLRG